MQIDWETQGLWLMKKQKSSFLFATFRWHWVRIQGSSLAAPQPDWDMHTHVNSVSNGATSQCSSEKGVPRHPEPHPRWRGQPSPAPLFQPVDHRGAGTCCGGFAAELRPGRGDTPVGDGRDWCRHVIPHLVSALQGAGRKMLLTRKCEE